MKEALIEAFLGFDATLATPEVISTLKEIAGNKGLNKDNDDSGKHMRFFPNFFSQNKL